MNRSPRDIHLSPAYPAFHGDGGNRTRAAFPPCADLEIPAFPRVLNPPSPLTLDVEASLRAEIEELNDALLGMREDINTLDTGE